MAKILEISVYSLRKIEKGEIPKKITIKILIDIYSNFGIMPSEMLDL